ncbi:unnamed protein product [Trichobilharzia regenti]|nr:unnamed protein product [Trichobilharzia regenti]
MCDYESGLVYQINNGDSIFAKIDLTTVIFSCFTILINPVALCLTFQVAINAHLLSILIMLEITSEILVAISQIANKLCPYFMATSQMWLNVLACYMWTSEFLISLFNSFCRQNILGMVIERCFNIYYPNTDLLRFPKTVGGLFCFSLTYNLISNLHLVISVELNSNGQCQIISEAIIEDTHKLDLIVLRNISLVMIDILPFVLVTVVCILVILSRQKHKRKNSIFINQQSGGTKSIQRQLDLLVLVWCSLGVIINAVDIFLDICDVYKECKFIFEVTHVTLELIRSIVFVMRSLTLFTILSPMRSEILKYLKIFSKYTQFCKNKT